MPPTASTRTETIYTRVTPEVREHLEKIAEADERSISFVVGLAIEQYVAKRTKDAVEEHVARKRRTK